ncbi:hypothetical protein B0H67DRAFT_639786 [Lasiosphaeris hirsuta]|uniref:Abscission/NoCut checkpoint regulator n=1 Tax=Lasiosphaeris hirsuta TaxID=260670 RepID=A0AA40BBV0_9PEZI|nr:hypothetical protein B0H67DRAFT_639786 [Lasiosphaeris hirsuta]
MAAPVRPSDRSLLDRLNALKPTSVTLDKAPNLITSNPGWTATTGSGFGRADQQPEPREDALSARLRNLRSGRGDSESPSAYVTADADATQPLYNPQNTGQKQKVSLDGKNPLSHEGVLNNSSSLLGLPGDPYLVEPDDQEALDAAAAVPTARAAKLAGLLSKLRRDSTSSAAARACKDQVPGEQSLHDDDSDGERMTKEVENVLSQLRDEINLSAQPAEKGGILADASDAKGDDASYALSLPTVPSSQPLDLEPEHEPSTHNHRKSLDFENDITARLASLRGLGAGINTDSFGLPSAPTFRPEERTTSSPAAGALRKQVGHTDEDQNSWCIVCLDDATICCNGCDDDVYCARCWKEMHFGPLAGYDERGHKWAKFVR